MKIKKKRCLMMAERAALCVMVCFGSVPESEAVALTYQGTSPGIILGSRSCNLGS